MQPWCACPAPRVVRLLTPSLQLLCLLKCTCIHVPVKCCVISLKQCMPVGDFSGVLWGRSTITGWRCIRQYACQRSWWGMPSHWQSGGGADSHLGDWDGTSSAFCGSSFSLMSKGFPDGSLPSAAAAAAAVDTVIAAGVVPLCSSLPAR